MLRSGTHTDELRLEFVFDSAKLGFRCDSLFASLLLNLLYFVKGLNELFVCVGERFNVDDTALRFLCYVNRSLVESGGVLFSSSFVMSVTILPASIA